MNKLKYLLLLLAFCMTTAAFSQQKKVTLSLNNVTVKAALEALTAQSGLSYWFDTKDVDMQKVISINLKSKSIDEALKTILQGQGVRYEIKSDHIVISKSPAQKEDESPASGGSKKITGKVTDDKGGEMPGVTVMIKGSSVGTITDVNGHYELAKVTTGSTLEFSFVGMASTMVKVGSQTVINATLKEADTKLNEVVVVGYGTTTKKSLVSSITTLSTDELNKGAITDVGQLLEGKAAGLNITSSGNPNAAASVIMRGPSTMNSSETPFYVIDGIPGADISTVAPDDIASIDILKDASATAIYGNRAANGVIMITTKRGKLGSTKVTYSGYEGIQSVSNELKMMNASQLRAFCTTNNEPLSSLDDKGADTNWQKAIEVPSALSTNHNLSFSGGSEHSDYSANISYNNTAGVIQKSNSQKTILHLAIDQFAFDDKVKFSLSVANSYIVADNTPQLNTALLQAVSYLPVSPVKNADGSYFEDFTNTGYFNPVAMINHGQDQTKYNNLVGAFKMHAILPFGLTYDANVSYQNYNSLHGEYYDSYYSQYNSENFYNNPDPPTVKSLVNFGTNGAALRSTYQNTNEIFENFITWNKKFGVHSINAVFGYSYENDVIGDGFQATTTNFPVDNAGFSNLALSNYSAVSGYTVNFGSTQSYYKTLSISDFARVNYNYQEKYYLQASLRRDGSSVFGSNHQWGYFPSVGASWRVVQEDFMQKQTLFNDLKLRASYGVTGNSTGFNAYTAQFISSNVATYYYNGSTMSADGPIQTANPNLKWERTATANIGIDFSMLKGRFGGSVEVYNKNTTDMIMGYAVDPMLVPTGSITANGGSMNNRGVEISLNATPVQNKVFTWKSVLNLAGNRNRITSLSNPLFQGGDSIRYTQPDGAGQTNSTLQIQKVGYPLGEFFTLQYAGKNAKGVSQYVSANGTLTTSPTTNDYHYAGSPQPKLIYGWTNTFFYKNFDLNVFLRGVYGNKIFNATRADLFRPTTAHLNNILEDAAGESTADVNSYKYSTRFIEDGSYLRLDNLTLGYTLKNPVKYVERIRVYSSVSNLFVITGYKGIDPEINMGGLAPGVDSNNFYPKTRTVLFGLNVSF
jgi:iron complex outermembrane receptor protein